MARRLVRLKAPEEEVVNLRKVISLISLVSFAVILATSVILFIAPQGRVAYWADWRLLGLDKDQWGAIHINAGFLFLAVLFAHIYYNWKAIVSYLKNKARQFRLFTTDFLAALVIVLVVCLGTLLGLQPMQVVLDWNAAIKDAAARAYGEPPYGHAELSSLESFAAKVDEDLPAALERLRQAGYNVADPALSLKEIAAENNVSPQQLYLAMVPASGPGQKVMPESPSPGTGDISLLELCRRYGLDVEEVFQVLGDAGISATSEQSLKDIAGQHGKSPVDIYFLIRSNAF